MIAEPPRAGKPDRIEPELCRRPIAANVNVGRLISFGGVEKERVRAYDVDGRHAPVSSLVGSAFRQMLSIASLAVAFNRAVFYVEFEELEGVVTIRQCINTTIPERVPNAIDRFTRQHGQARSGFLFEAATERIAPARLPGQSSILANEWFSGWPLPPPWSHRDW